MDTEQYASWFRNVHGVPRERFRLVPNGADTTGFLPKLTENPRGRYGSAADSGFRVLYHGTFIDNHGVPTIVEAANLLQEHTEIQFELVGDGPERPAAEALIRKYGLCNVRMAGWLDQQTLRERIAASDLCLGVFGTTPQSMMTVHHKVKECLAMAKPVITGDSQAIRDAFEHGRHVYLCRRADPLALAVAIVELQQHRQSRLEMAHAGRELILHKYTIECNGARFKTILQQAVKRTNHRCTW